MKENIRIFDLILNRNFLYRKYERFDPNQIRFRQKFLWRIQSNFSGLHQLQKHRMINKQYDFFAINFSLPKLFIIKIEKYWLKNLQLFKKWAPFSNF